MATKKLEKLIAGSDFGEVWAVDEYRNSRAQVLTHAKIAVSEQARFALAMIERWGMVAGAPDGEDSAGRSKLALMPIADVVSRAFVATELAFEEAAKRGWTMPLPSYSEFSRALTSDDEA